MAFLRTLHKSGIRASLFVISLYQRTLSPDHGVFKYVYGGPVCRYSPTCSEYTASSIKQFGYAGVWMGVKRVLSCNSFNNKHL
ncbi:MAG: membrane protein insertion efficiency factor YidD [Candidatus Andersenbacteria bacterium]